MRGYRREENLKIARNLNAAVRSTIRNKKENVLGVSGS